MLFLEQAIIDKITAEVAGLTTVGNPSLLAGLRDIGPLLPACIVMPGAGEPVDAGKSAVAPLSEAQDWDVVIIVAHQATKAADGQTETIAGGFMTAVLKALQGKKISSQQRLGFVYQGRSAPNYGVGYAEFPLTFSTQAVVGI